MRTDRVVLPVADNILKAVENGQRYHSTFSLNIPSRTKAKNIHFKMLSATGRTTLPVNSFFPSRVVGVHVGTMVVIVNGAVPPHSLFWPGSEKMSVLSAMLHAQSSTIVENWYSIFGKKI